MKLVLQKCLLMLLMAALPLLGFGSPVHMGCASHTSDMHAQHQVASAEPTMHHHQDAERPDLHAVSGKMDCGSCSLCGLCVPPVLSHALVDATDPVPVSLDTGIPPTFFASIVLDGPQRPPQSVRV